jgi:ribonucleoside-diphosphate reductase alpha chain
MLSLWLRANGSLDAALKQLDGIGSSLTVPTKDGRIMSLADGLARALHRYLTVKKEHGLEALLLGRVPESALAEAGGSDEGRGGKGGQSASARYKLKCPGCADVLAFEEGCVKCYGCGYSQC